MELKPRDLFRQSLLETVNLIAVGLLIAFGFGVIVVSIVQVLLNGEWR